MKNFEVDVSGEDLLNKDYTICIADKNNLIKGFKFQDNLVKDLSLKYSQGHYKYNKSKKGKSDFKIRLYCIAIYYLFKSLKLSGEISLNVCRDFIGREDDIRKSLIYFLEEKLEFILNDRVYFDKLPKDSNAHKYSFLMREDKKDKMNTYINISLKDFEIWLKK
jgi:hypothetical protein